MKKRKFGKLVKRVVRELQVQGYIKNPYIFDPKQEPAKFQPPVSLDAARRYCRQLLLERAIGGNK